jgi:hypothetical protein
VIRNNTFTHTLVFNEGDFGTMVLLPVDDGGILADNIIEGNVQNGTFGFGVLAGNLSNTTITGNVIRDVRKQPFQGKGGIAISLERQSHGNSISGNVLERTAFCDVRLRHATFRNVVVESDDTVLDNGRRNVVVSDGSCGAEAVVQSEMEEDQVAIPAKLRIQLRKLQRYHR